MIYSGLFTANITLYKTQNSVSRKIARPPPATKKNKKKKEGEGASPP
jgi:hypothetical protein